jgi:hypothetical protein
VQIGRLLLLAVLVVVRAGAALPKFPDGFFSKTRIEEGRTVSATLCASCHLFPEPAVLDKETWLNGPLPWMMTLCGLNPQGLPPGIEGELILKSGAILPANSISKSDYGKVIAYYISSAPDKLPPPARPPTAATLKQFTQRALLKPGLDATTTLVRVDSGSGAIWAGGDWADPLIRVRANGDVLGRVAGVGRPVAIAREGGSWLLTDVGTFSPSQQPGGALRLLTPSTDGGLTHQELAPRLHRPVTAAAADFNGDGTRDWLVASFGWYTGSLSWFETGPQSAPREHVLLPKPGAVAVHVEDFDKDGDADVIALIAQATESLLLFRNDGRGGFSMETLLQRHPSFGFTHLEAADMDGDGTRELILTNGDNGDYPSPVKPYHGVRIYSMNVAGRCEERFFFQMPGATRVTTGDFDGDGDTDLACVAYYADFKDADALNFVLLENLGGFRFAASTFAERLSGRWLTLDAGDVDGDGDADIVLGAMRKGPGRDTYIPPALAERWQREPVAAMLLENISR